jgi:hypothetical protein
LSKIAWKKIVNNKDLKNHLRYSKHREGFKVRKAYMAMGRQIQEELKKTERPGR